MSVICRSFNGYTLLLVKKKNNKQTKKENKNKIRLYVEGKRLVDKAYFVWLFNFKKSLNPVIERRKNLGVKNIKN